MTPVVLRKGQFEVVIYTKDHNPPHVHVKAPEKRPESLLSPLKFSTTGGSGPAKSGLYWN